MHMQCVRKRKLKCECISTNAAESVWGNAKLYLSHAPVFFFPSRSTKTYARLAEMGLDPHNSKPGNI